MRNIYIISTLLLITFCSNSYGQGCSDAGFCTAGSIKPNSSTDSIKNGLGLTISYAIGEQGTTYIIPQFEPQIRISDHSMVQIKIPYININGKLGTNNGLGDIIITYNHILPNQFKKPITFTIGTRIASGAASIKIDNVSMPMPYQVSLGTTDLILGAKINFKKGFSISAGYQQPLVNRNQNGFDSAAYKSLKITKQLQDDENYFISSGLNRKGDVMLRIDKVFQWRKTTLNIGLLPIYHLGNDRATISKGKNVEIENSNGLTLNLNAGATYKINNQLDLSLIAATPLLVRKSRPDGLTRSIVCLSGILYYF